MSRLNGYIESVLGDQPSRVRTTRVEVKFLNALVGIIRIN